MPSAAESLLPLIQQLCGGQPPLRIRCWDGSEISTADCNACATGDGQPASDAAIVITSPVALRRILWQPNELGFSRAYVAGEIEVEGGIWPLFQLQALLSHDDRPNGWKARLEAGRRLFAAVRGVGALGRPPEPPPEEARLHGSLHSRGRDAQAIAHHYDVSNDFYRLFLGETMLAISYDGEDRMKHIPVLVLMYFTYCQVWIYIVIKALWIEYIKKEKRTWDKTVRFDVDATTAVR